MWNLILNGLSGWCVDYLKSLWLTTLEFIIWPPRIENSPALGKCFADFRAGEYKTPCMKGRVVRRMCREEEKVEKRRVNGETGWDRICMPNPFPIRRVSILLLLFSSTFSPSSWKTKTGRVRRSIEQRNTTCLWSFSFKLSLDNLRKIHFSIWTLLALFHFDFLQRFLIFVLNIAFLRFLLGLLPICFFCPPDEERIFFSSECLFWSHFKNWVFLFTFPFRFYILSFSLFLFLYGKNVA